jgi:uncharacterized protein DUF3303
MKYMLEYTARAGGVSFDESVSGSQTLLTAFGKWKPEEGLKIHAFVSDLVGRGGYVLAEADDPRIITSFVSKFNFWNDISVIPIVDIGEVIPITTGSLDWARKSAQT